MTKPPRTKTADAKAAALKKREAKILAILARIDHFMIDQTKEVRQLRNDVNAMGDCLDSYLMRDQLQRQVIRALYPVAGAGVAASVRKLMGRLGMVTGVGPSAKDDDDNSKG